MDLDKVSVRLDGRMCGEGATTDRPVPTTYHPDSHGALYYDGHNHFAVCTPLKWCHVKDDGLKLLLLHCIGYNLPLTDIVVDVAMGESETPEIISWYAAAPKKPTRLLSNEEIDKLPEYGTF